MERWRLEWDRGRAEVIAPGAMLHDLVLHPPGGSEVRPLAEAPWREDGDIAADASLPSHLRQLGGEWPCVPFGTSPADPEHHGHATNADWTLVARDETSLTLACRFPAHHAVERLERTVRAVPGKAALEMRLAVEVRRDCRLPIGLHPIFRVSGEEGGLALRPGAFGYGQVFPVPFQPEVSRLEPGARFAALAAVPTAGGGTASLAALPRAALREELVQLWNTDGRLALADAASGAEIRLTWDPAAFPHCLLWISNGGREARPWNGRFRGLGVEPVCAFFDHAGLPGADASRERTGMDFRAGTRWETTYRLDARQDPVRDDRP